MIVFVGASASGKTELAKMLCNKYNYKKCITTTTRPMRPNERQDVDYHFLDKVTFEKMMKDNLFVEVTEYQGNYYGIQKQDVISNGVVIVDPNGANALIKAFADRIYIVFVDSPQELRKKRMLQRGDAVESVENRILKDENIFKKENLLRVNLHLKNENNSLEELALSIHEAYQKFLHDLDKKNLLIND